MNSLKFRPQLETMDERIVPDAAPTVTIPDAEQMLLKDSTTLVDLESQTQAASDNLAAAQRRGDADGIAYWSQNFADTATSWAGVREDYTGLLGEYQVAAYMSAYDVLRQISDFHPDVLDAVPGATAAVTNVQVGVVPVVAPQAPADPKGMTTAQLDKEIADLKTERVILQAVLKNAQDTAAKQQKVYDDLFKQVAVTVGQWAAAVQALADYEKANPNDKNSDAYKAKAAAVQQTNDAMWFAHGQARGAYTQLAIAKANVAGIQQQITALDARLAALQAERNNR